MVRQRFALLLAAGALAGLPVAAFARPTPAPHKPASQSCTKPSAVQRISFSAIKYPNIRRHFRAALARGWTRTLVLNR